MRSWAGFSNSRVGTDCTTSLATSASVPSAHAVSSGMASSAATTSLKFLDPLLLRMTRGQVLTRVTACGALHVQLLSLQSGYRGSVLRNNGRCKCHMRLCHSCPYVCNLHAHHIPSAADLAAPNICSGSTGGGGISELGLRRSWQLGLAGGGGGGGGAVPSFDLGKSTRADALHQYVPSCRWKLRGVPELYELLERQGATSSSTPSFCRSHNPGGHFG